jgi:hypothetical protein
MKNLRANAPALLHQNRFLIKRCVRREPLSI